MGTDRSKVKEKCRYKWIEKIKKENFLLIKRKKNKKGEYKECLDISRVRSIQIKVTKRQRKEKSPIQSSRSTLGWLLSLLFCCKKYLCLKQIIHNQLSLSQWIHFINFTRFCIFLSICVFSNINYSLQKYYVS